MSEEMLVRTAARWKIPRDLALKVIRRDERCVYCKHAFEFPLGPKARWPSWEHIINDSSLVNESNIALCCWGCNASKRAKVLKTWLTSSYCLSRGIDATSISSVVQAALATNPEPHAPVNVNLRPSTS